MRRLQRLLTAVIGIMLILVGLRLVISPNVYYTRRETAIRTQEKKYSVNRDKSMTIPRPVSSLIIAAGTTILIFATRAGRRH